MLKFNNKDSRMMLMAKKNNRYQGTPYEWKIRRESNKQANNDNNNGNNNNDDNNYNNNYNNNPYNTQKYI